MAMLADRVSTVNVVVMRTQSTSTNIYHISATGYSNKASSSLYVWLPIEHHCGLFPIKKVERLNLNNLRDKVT